MKINNIEINDKKEVIYIEQSPRPKLFYQEELYAMLNYVMAKDKISSLEVHEEARVLKIEVDYDGPKEFHFILWSDNRTSFILSAEEHIYPVIKKDSKYSTIVSLLYYGLDNHVDDLQIKKELLYILYNEKATKGQQHLMRKYGYCEKNRKNERD